jgi:hypothetical protein
MTKIKNLKLSKDSYSLNIFVDNGEDKDPTHIVYWTEDEWLEDAETVVPAMLTAMELFYMGKHIQLVETIGLMKFIDTQKIYCTVCESAYVETTQTDATYNCTMCEENVARDEPNRKLPIDNVDNDYVIDCGND